MFLSFSRFKDSSHDWIRTALNLAATDPTPSADKDREMQMVESS